ncbi:MAG: hypothetical protein H7Z17_10980, partial [Fuerstia sp.]|nr:hypothetical protein [Fuerstiella sp.]
MLSFTTLEQQERSAIIACNLEFMMSTVRKIDFISVEEYLAGEQQSSVKHEYVAGLVYAMVGARNAHNIIASNALGSL